MIRIVATGSECTGKTTLASHLASVYRAELVPEYVREYAERKGGVISFEDNGPIARGQIALEDEHIARARDLVIQDTDLLSTVVYCRHYFGYCPAWIEDAARARRPSVYLLCFPDIPWVADGVRDRGDRRDEMHGLFAEAVAASGTPSVKITGTVAERIEVAHAVIKKLLGGPRSSGAARGPLLGR